MKLSTLFGLIITASTITQAVAQETPEAAWGKTFYGKTKSSNQAQNNAIASDGGIYWHLVGGSVHDERDVYFNNELLFSGADYDPNGTSVNNNFCLMKTDRSGDLLWKLYSTTCDWATNQGRVAATSDGGAVFTGKIRSTDDGGTGDFLWNDITLVDGQNSIHRYTWNHTESDSRRFYQVIVGRVDANGKLLWVKFLQADRSPVPAATGNYATFTSEAIDCPALAVDNDDNIYIGGNFRQKIEIETGDQSVVLNPHNISKWNGDPQSHAGDMYLIKLDGSNGTYIKHAVTSVVSGDPQCENIQQLVWENGMLYAQGVIYGDGSTLDLNGKQFTNSGTFSPILVSMDSSLTPHWITSLKGETVKSKYGFQNCGISKTNNTLWFSGMFNGKVSYSDAVYFESDAATPSVREGFLAKFDATTGEMLKGVSSRASYPTTLGAAYKSLAGYFQPLQNPNEKDKVYVYGYSMINTLGVFLRTYNTETLESDPSTEWSLVQGGQMPTCQSISYSPEDAKIYITARGRNNDFKLMGGSTVPVPENQVWAVLLAGYDMPAEFKSVGVATTISDNRMPVKIYGCNGILTIINNDKDAKINIYTVTGNLAASLDAPYGTTTVHLPKGIYIANGQKIVL